MDILILILALALFTILAFKGVSAVVMGPLIGLLVALFSKLPLTETMLGPFMESTASYVQNYFFIFFLGAVFGAIYEETGAAKSIAVGIVKFSKGKMTASIITIITGILTLGGISGFVVFFVIYPIALQLFRENNISRKILPGAISAGCWTFSMIAPMSPSIQNVIASKTLGTPIQAAMVPGLVATIFEIVAIILWLEWRTSKLKKAGLNFDDPNLTPLPDSDVYTDDATAGNLPNFFLCLVPLLAIILTFNLWPQIFKVEASVFLGILLAIILFGKRLPGKSFMEKLQAPLNAGGANGVSAIMNTAVVVGFGGVVRNTAGFNNLVGYVLNLNMSPLVFVAIAVGICAGAVGSASGGITIAFDALKDTFISMGVNLEYVHRIGVIAAGTLDTLPHQGAQITLLNLCHLTHKEGYLDIAVTQIVIPIITLFIVIPLCNMGL
jgi:H+/gluconate symporter-like permease